jgi:branched-chain amino acid transport system substrate-binding protein
MSFAGSNGLRFFRQWVEYGMNQRLPLIGGMTAVDEANLQQMGDQAVGLISSCWYAATLDNPDNVKFRADMQKTYHVDPGFYAAGPAVAGAVLEAALKKIDGKIEDKQALMKTLHTEAVQNTVRGPVHFDQYGNVIGNVYIRKVAKENGRLVNQVIKTYPDVSQFWTYQPDEFMKSPVYSRDWPPAKNLEQ